MPAGFSSPTSAATPATFRPPSSPHFPSAATSTKHGPILLLRFGSRRVLLVTSPTAAGRRMPHKERHPVRQPPSTARRQDFRLQLLQLGLVTIRRPLAQPSTDIHRRGVVISSPE
ncbi:hypothetical protein R6Q59_023481 [Mikania micrantha]